MNNLKMENNSLYQKLFGKIGSIQKHPPNEIPNGIGMDISGYCNLDCQMCSLQAHYNSKGFMSLETVKKLKNIIQNLNGISLSCGCEPLLNKDIFGIIKYIRQLNPNIWIGMSTNGTLITPNISSELLRLKLNSLNVSIDGATKETFEKIRKGASFETVISNVKELIFQRNNYKNELQVSITAVATKDNVHELIDILRLVNNLGVNSLYINGLEPYTEEMSYKILYDENNSKYEYIFSNLKTKATEYNIDLRLPSLILQPYNSCSLIKTPTIDWKGNVHPCSPLYYGRPFYYLGEKEFHPEIYFGNINDKDMIEIWNSRKYRKFRDNVTNGRFPIYCKKCLMMNQVLCKLN